MQPITEVDGTRPEFRVEADFIAALFNALNILQGMGYDPLETLSTFLANLACDQEQPHLTLKRLHRMSYEKMSYMKKKERS